MKPEALGRVESAVDGQARKMRDFFTDMLRINAVNPRMGGPGERERAGFIEKFLKENGFSVERVDVKDDGAPGGTRPSISAKIAGRDSRRTLWYISHMDTVPEGSRSLWKTDPFEPVVKDGKVYARGAEDNGQSLVASLFGLLALKEVGAELPFDVGVWFVADEEFGSDYGIKALLGRKVFKKTDLVVVPDAGTPTGADIEIAEKGLLWMKVTTEGKQVHASLPKKGLNAHRIGMKLALEMDDALNGKYTERNKLFDYPVSSFEPTKVEPNVGNINTIPGEDVFYFDCRVLPEYDLESVVRDMKSTALRVERRYGAKVRFEKVQMEPAGPATDTDSEVAVLLEKAVSAVAGVKPRFIGIGGQTVGNLFRKSGIPTAVWSTIDDVPHEPNEYSKLANLVNDAKVFASVPLLY
ncbi:MAG: M20 family metallo-hydrolase [Nitrososphaerota archaeon]|jgi:succinyl-diaminopimelate desuccinylase|nr:M20 family metallo-hydrolase [Nitrososphaerota archaeon]MDG6941871.1 M20 family metallo-hydrolase [Nitrososphaerota archaeon]MDG6946956.1 M20 family metallo-hydrolase [Nitrososphaerota archaeon]MDG6950632.1 M20 family metallo-hydrolase [Nitrososphaerota archaeon]